MVAYMTLNHRGVSSNLTEWTNTEYSEMVITADF